MKAFPDIDKLFDRLNELLDRVESFIPLRKVNETDSSFRAYRWAAYGLDGISDFDKVDKSELLHIERQKNLISRNTAQFLQGKPANNALLWGARGYRKIISHQGAAI